MHRYLVLDVETTFIKDGIYSDNRPYNPANKLVSLGYKNSEVEHYWCTGHNVQPTDRDAKASTQAQLDKCELLVGHNIKFDLTWLRECGYIYNGKLWDTMLVAKLISGGHLMANQISLSACCERAGLPVKTDVVGEYWNGGTSTDDIPWGILEEYGRNDIVITEKLYQYQVEIIND